MDPQINYPIAILIVVAAIIFIALLVKRNQKDERRFEKDITRSELKPDDHKDQTPHV